LSHLGAVRRDILGFLAGLAGDYGDVVAFSVGPISAVLLNHPDHVAEVLVTRHQDVVKGRPLRLARRLLGDGLLTSEGALHARQSRLVSPALHAQRVRGYAGSVVELAGRVGDEWRDGAPVDMMREMVKLATAVAGRTMFQWDMNPATAGAIGRALDDAVALFSRGSVPLADRLLWLPLPSNRRFVRARAYLDAVIYRLIAERRADGRDHGDLLSLLLRTHEEGTGGGMTDRQLRDEALTLFVTAFDTVSLALTWTWYLLAQHPAEVTLLEQELDRVVPGRFPTADDLPDLGYTRAVVAESLRLFPPVYAIAREAVAPLEVGGFTIRPGTLILVSPYLLQRDSRFYADPTRFDPARWIDGPKPPRFAYFPFGGGPRGCIGQAYALQEAALSLATLARRWRATLAAPGPVRLRPLINLRPADGLPMVLHARQAAAVSRP
jgi:cytochrome P450